MQNQLSIVIWIKAGDCFFLLGSDLENETSNESGWQRIVLNENYPKGKACYFKHPHHGSETGHNANVWDNLLIKNPITCITPFRRGNKKLPKNTDIERIYRFTDKAYSTSDGKLRKALKRTAPVMKTIKETVKMIRPVFTSTGQIRFRIKPKEEAFPRVELLNGAMELRGVLEFG